MFFSGWSIAALPANDEVVERIYKCAKSSDHTLSEAEILECMQPAPQTSVRAEA